MSQLPSVVWVVAAGLVLFLLGLCAAVTYAVLRPAARRRVAGWPTRRIAGLAGAALLPWLVMGLVPLEIDAKIHGVWALLGWLLLALLSFALLVLLPLGALLSGAVWWAARRRRDRAVTPAA